MNPKRILALVVMLTCLVGGGLTLAQVARSGSPLEKVGTGPNDSNPGPFPMRFDPDELRPANASETRAAEGTIRAQLDAFDIDDYHTAMSYQCAEVRSAFHSPDNFRSMMENNYPAFAHYKSVRFAVVKASPDGRYVLVPTLVQGKNRTVVRAMYVMVMEQDKYRVMGVRGEPDYRPVPEAMHARHPI